MYKVLAKIVLSIFLLSADFLTVYTQNVATTTPSSAENVIVNIKDFIKPEHVVSSLNSNNNNKSEKSSVGDGFARTARAKTSTSMKEIFACVIALDPSCLVDRAEDIVDNANSNLLREADIEARKISFGRADEDGEEDSSPSTLISSIAKMVLELPELLKDSISGMIRTGKLGIPELGGGGDSEEDEENDDEEADDRVDGNDEEEEDDEEGGDEADDDDEEDGEGKSDDDDEEEEESILEAKDVGESERKKCGKKGGGGGCVQGSQQSSSSMESSDNSGDYFDGFGFGDGYGTAHREVGDARGKKKKKKKAIVKLILLGLLLKAKITLLLKVLAAKLQIKFLIIALANLLLNFVRLWWDLKKGHQEQPQKVIYYEHAQHQHHYDGGEDWHSGPGGGGGGGGYWARSYDEENNDEKSAQDMAYKKQIPQGTTYSRVNDKPNISWNPWG